MNNLIKQLDNNDKIMMASLLTLQKKNLRANLADKGLEGGFLSTEFSETDFKELNVNSSLIVVSTDGTNVNGYLVICSDKAQNEKVPIVNRMIEISSNIKYNGIYLDLDNVAIYGPACIDTNFRGKGILLSLIQNAAKLFQEKPNSKRYCLLFISKSNTASLKAHYKLGLKDIDKFIFNSVDFRILLLDLDDFR